jgi:hypothetical protein
VAFSLGFERIWLESKKRLPEYMERKPADTEADFNSSLFFAKSIISRSFKWSFREEFKIPGGKRHYRRRHQFRYSTPNQGAPNAVLCSRDLVITDVSDEILNSRTGGNSLRAMLN